MIVVATLSVYVALHVRKVKKRKNRFSGNSKHLLYTSFCESTVVCNLINMYLVVSVAIAESNMDEVEGFVLTFASDTTKTRSCDHCDFGGGREVNEFGYAVSRITRCHKHDACLH